MAEITVLDDAQLLTREYLHLVGKAFKEAGRSRFGMADWLTETLSNWTADEGRACDSSGRPIELSEEMVEAAFDQGQWFTWATDVKKFADRLPSRRPRKSLLPRLRLIDLAFRIAGRPVA